VSCANAFTLAAVRVKLRSARWPTETFIVLDL
jgi:hypothetical protein